MTQQQQPPAGWYANPEGEGQRYWDGQQWTDQRRDAPPPPPPPPGGQAPSERQVVYVEQAGNGLAVAALVTGIVGLVLGFIPILFFIAWALGITAFVLGLVARRRAVRKPHVGRKGMATAGIVLGVLAFGMGIVGLAVLDDIFSDTSDELDRAADCLDRADTPEEIAEC
jgi:Domain of unknown function (DUF4190)/Protein of unknown function (DUF2510)